MRSDVFLDQQAESAVRQSSEAGETASSFFTVREGQSLVIRVNTGADVGAQPRLNLIQGTNVSISAVDDPTSSEIDVTISVPTATPTPLVVATKTSAYTLTDGDDVILVDATGGAVTVTLHAVASAKKKVYRFKKMDASANAMTIDGAGAETVDGAATQATTTQFGVIRIFPTGSEWITV